MTLPMEWEYTCPETEPDPALESRIYNRIVPSSCFTSDDDTKIARQCYFEDHNVSLCEVVEGWRKRPYCWVCFAPDVNGNNVVEHEHDNRLVDSKKLTPGKFRARACRSCNSIESHAKKIPEADKRFDYWAKKKGWNTDEEKRFYFSNLRDLGYLSDSF